MGYVKNYGELMEEWLNGRITQCNDDFLQRVTSVLGTNLAAVCQRMRRTFRPGKWLSLTDGKLLDDLYQLFADKTFPKHVLIPRTVTKALRQVSSFGGGDFQFYNDIARLPPQRPSYLGPPAQDSIDAKIIEVLERLPPFPSLSKLQPSLYSFGRLQVVFAVLGDGNLVARTTNSEGGQSEVSAEHFFVKKGPEEFPDAARMAVQASAMQHPSGPPATPIEMVGAFSPAAPPQLSLHPGSASALGGPDSTFQAAPALGHQRYAPYPGAQGPPPQMSMPQPTAPSPGMNMPPSAQAPMSAVPVFGVEDDEI